MQRTILVTGFEPFGGSSVNPSAEAVKALRSVRIPRVAIATGLLPVVGGEAQRRLRALVSAKKPDAVVCLGESGAATAITIERLAANLRDYRIADNAGATVVDSPVAEGGPAAYFATLPVRAMHDACRAAGVPAELSMSAGTYLCNETMYALLHHASTTNASFRAGFVHVPQLPEQVLAERRGRASMSLDTTMKGLVAMLRVVAGAKRSR
jgi:pyroglutamyl-peptidase